MTRAVPRHEPAEIAALLGPGTRLIPFTIGYLRLPSGLVTAVEVDLSDPLTTGIMTLSEGRLPGVGEVAVTPALGLRPGDLLRPAGAPPLKVSGIVDHPHQPTIRQVTGPRPAARGNPRPAPAHRTTAPAGSPTPRDPSPGPT